MVDPESASDEAALGMAQTMKNAAEIVVQNEFQKGLMQMDFQREAYIRQQEELIRERREQGTRKPSLADQMKAAQEKRDRQLSKGAPKRKEVAPKTPGVSFNPSGR